MDALTLLTDWLPSWAAHLVVALDLVALMAFAATAQAPAPSARTFRS